MWWMIHTVHAEGKYLYLMVNELWFVFFEEKENRTLYLKKVPYPVHEHNHTRIHDFCKSPTILSSVPVPVWISYLSLCQLILYKYILHNNYVLMCLCVLRFFFIRSRIEPVRYALLITMIDRDNQTIPVLWLNNQNYRKLLFKILFLYSYLRINLHVITCNEDCKPFGLWFKHKS